MTDTTDTSVFCAVPNVRGRTHEIVSCDPETGVAVTVCGRTIHTRWTVYGEAAWRTGWGYHVDCKRCQKGATQ
jgi:hypothetical protein